jgi:hypothetical protein
MIRSISYSRYLRIATPMQTGSAMMPIQMTSPAARSTGEGSSPDVSRLMTRDTVATVTPLASHLSCWRRSPDARRHASTWRATHHTRNGKPMRDKPA